MTTGVLSGGRARRPTAFRIRSRRGRVVSAASPYHAVYRPTAAFLGVLKVASSDVPALVAAVGHVGPIAAAPPQAWLDELDRKALSWRLGLARMAAGGELLDEPVEDEDDVGAGSRRALRRGRGAAAQPDGRRPRRRRRPAVGRARPRRRGARRQPPPEALWSRPQDAGAAAEAAREIGEIDEDRVLLDSAVKGTDGFFTTFFVCPYSRYIARWAARRGFTPNQVTTASVLIGLLAAVAFATGERWGLVAGAVLLQVAFTTDCVDGQLARYTRTFSKLGAWLDSVFDRTKEYLAFAGLAIGASRLGDPVWLLACAAITPRPSATCPTSRSAPPSSKRSAPPRSRRSSSRSTTPARRPRRVAPATARWSRRATGRSPTACWPPGTGSTAGRASAG